MPTKTIIIDDSKLFRQILKDACLELGCNVLIEFDNGDDFVKKLEEGEYLDLDILFLDINMPGRSGKELIDPILDLHPELIIIMISTFNDMATVDTCLDLGATNYINKDTKIEQMKSIIQNTLEMNSMM